MRALIRKSLRDLWLMRGQALAIALVMACGVATFTMSLSTRAALQAALDRYYATRSLADVFAPVKRAPEALAARIADLPGVARVQTRVVAEVNLDIPGESEAVTGRLVSLPPDPAAASGLNRLTLRSGLWPVAGRRGEVLVSEAFATARGLRPGDRLAAVINGRREELRVTGVALSPEYVYEIRPGAMFPDNRRFGVMWMERRAPAAARRMRRCKAEQLHMVCRCDSHESRPADCRRKRRYHRLHKPLQRAVPAGCGQPSAKRRL